jgi:hypothetical protein
MAKSVTKNAPQLLQHGRPSAKPAMCMHFPAAFSKHSLGKWLHPPHKLRDKWPFYYDPPTNSLIRRHEKDFTIHSRELAVYAFDASSHSDFLPTTAIPIDVQHSDYCWRRNNHCSCLTVTPLLPSVTAWPEKCSNPFLSGNSCCSLVC